MVQALRALVAATPGLSWSTDTAPDIAELVNSRPTVDSFVRHFSHDFQVRETSMELMQAGLTDSILGLLSSMDWTTDLAGLQKAAALGDAQHVHTVRALHQETRQGLADTLYRYSAQVGLSAQAVTRILEYLAKATPDTATGQLDGVTAALVMAVVSAMDVSGVGRGEVDLPVVKDANFLTTVGREVEGRSRKWECPGLTKILRGKKKLTAINHLQVYWHFSNCRGQPLYQDSGRVVPDPPLLRLPLPPWRRTRCLLISHWRDESSTTCPSYYSTLNV